MSDDFGNQRQRFIELIQGIYQLRQQPWMLIDIRRLQHNSRFLHYRKLNKYCSWDALLQAANLPVKDNLTNQTRRPYTNRTRSIWSAEQSFLFTKNKGESIFRFESIKNFVNIT